jgi:hypothetical protein
MANEVDNYLTIKGSTEDIAEISALFTGSEVIDEDLPGRSVGLFSRSHIKLKKGETTFFINPGTKKGEKHINYHYEGKVYLREGRIRIDDENTLEAYLQTAWEPVESGWLESLVGAFPMITVINEYEDEYINYYGKVCWIEGSYDENASFEIGSRPFEKNKKRKRKIPPKGLIEKKIPGGLYKIADKIEKLNYTVLVKSVSQCSLDEEVNCSEREWQNKVTDIDTEDWEFSLDCAGAEILNIEKIDNYRSRIEKMSSDETDGIYFIRVFTVKVSIHGKDLESLRAEIRKDAPKVDFFKISRKNRLSEIYGILNWMLDTNYDWSEEEVDCGNQNDMYSGFENILIRSS